MTLMTQGVQNIITGMKSDPGFLLEVILANNPVGVSQNIHYHYGIRVISSDVDDIYEGIQQALESNTEHTPSEIMQNILSTAIIPEGLTAEGNLAVFQIAQERGMINAQDFVIAPGQVLPLGLPEGWQDTGYDPTSSQGNAPGFDWAGFATGLIPGILDIFGFGSSSNGNTSDTSSQNAALQQMLLDQQKQAAKMNSILMWMGIGIGALLSIFLVVRLTKK